MLRPNRLFAVILLGLAALSGAALAADAQVNPNHDPPINIHWAWAETWTMAPGASATIDLTSATLVLTDVFDFDDFDDTMELDASTSITGGAGEALTLSFTDGTDNLFAVLSGTDRWIDLDLGASNILRLTQTAGLDLALGNSTGDVTITSDNLNVAGSPILSANSDLTFTAGTGTLTLNHTVTNASDDALLITPSYTGGAADLRLYNAISIAAFGPTNAVGTDTVVGLNVGAMTDPGGSISSTGISVGTGWDIGISTSSTLRAQGNTILGDADTDTIDINADLIFDGAMASSPDVRVEQAVAATAGQALGIIGQQGGVAAVGGDGWAGGTVPITGGAGTALDGAGANDGSGGDVVLLGGARGGATGTAVQGIVRVGAPTVGSTKTTNLLAVAGGVEVDGLLRGDAGLTVSAGTVTLPAGSVALAALAVPGAGQLALGNAGATAFELATMSSDATIAAGGALTIAANAVALGGDTTGAYVATVADSGGGHFTVAGSGAENGAVTLAVAADTIAATELAETLSLEAGNAILALGSWELGVVDGNFNTTVQLGDAAGVNLLRFEDSADALVASINSDGLATFAGGLTVSAGTVTLPVGEVGAGEITDIARSLPLPLGGWFDITARSIISVDDGADAQPDFTATNGHISIIYDVTAGSVDTNYIANAFVVPADWISGGTILVRLTKSGVTAVTENLSGYYSIDGAAEGAVSTVATAAQTAVQTVTLAPAGTLAVGASVGLRLAQSAAAGDDSVIIHGIEFQYTASQ